MIGRRMSQLHARQFQRLQAYDVPASVDMHCHCLPGIDDGPADLDEALELCRQLVLDGITQVIATPHQLGRYEGRNSSIEIRRAVEALNQRLEEAQIPLEVIAGAEVRLDERLPAMLQADEILLLPDGGDHVLLELPRGAFIDPFPLIRALYFRGITTVIAHPERQTGMSRRRDMLQRWIEEGALLQVNAGSFLGEFGPEAEANAWQWLEMGLVTLVASDTHSADRRPPSMSRAIELLESRVGTAMTRLVCIDNPLRLYRRLPMQPPAAPSAAPGGAA